MSDTVTVASRLPVAISMQAPIGGNGIETNQTIVGSADPSAVSGYGLTYNVDAAAFNQWLAANPLFVPFMGIVEQQQIDDHSDPANTYGHELGLVGEPPAPMLPPVNVDVPYIWQEEQRMRCTMGNWANEPVTYAYQWVQDGTLEIGPDNDTLPMLAANDGHTITCVVTATNAVGATTAPPSNSLLYTAPIVATSAELISGDFTDSEWSSVIQFFNNNSGFALGFDIVVDGINLSLAAVFGSITDASGICDIINAQLGMWLTASTSTFSPWQFFIHSLTTGSTSTISYASAPTTMSRGTLARPTQDVSIVMKLRQAVGAIMVQGIDASGVEE